MAQTPAPCDVRHNMDASEVHQITYEPLFSGFFSANRLGLRHPTFNGSLCDIQTREVFIGNDAALVIPYNPIHDTVLLVEQFRMGPYARGDKKPWMLEPVAGLVDPGETPEQCAIREVEEEAGIVLSNLHPISQYYTSPGCSTDYFHSFVGLCDLSDVNHRLGGLDAEREDIFMHVLAFDDALRLIETGEAQVGPLILMLLWLDRNRERLRASA
ncbi:NUDIX domain-containing protein [Parasulfitobacter algicola]|uniref:ADP-ribose pyrophosphatase n=1 Tax=Parasulfitobacter algicola TaxID=2614809 RepID=A0ABX2IRA9_9RHOB|nr:NUDIX domain-containing protein [Sulfitobacter algicola]NSX55414.1 NUDIX domain-containing protein [Sulfitobacter algicola]